MAIPEKIPIERVEDYHTHFIGHYEGGKQFMGFVTATLPIPMPDDWPAHKRWYAVLHTFDAEGNYINTESTSTGVTAEGESLVTAKAQEELEKMLNQLEGIKFGDVKVKLFSVSIDGHVFGLVDSSEPDEDYEGVELLPNGIGFFEPWDGSYDT